MISSGVRSETALCHDGHGRVAVKRSEQAVCYPFDSIQLLAELVQRMSIEISFNGVAGSTSLYSLILYTLRSPPV